VKVSLHNGIGQIDAAAWNALVHDNNPLLRHEFLLAMERHGCVGQQFGWLPHHLAVYDEGLLVGAMPLYEKHNAYGEFVFDHAWSDAYQRNGLAYYPKLVSAVPYTPATGQRLLAMTGREAQVWPLLLESALQLAPRIGASGLHILFPTRDEQRFLAGQHLLQRHDCQYHWPNRGYDDFEQFLATLVSRKRKRIRQERRKVADAGVRLRRLDGHSASRSDWQQFTDFYNLTFERKWGMATFNLDFFLEIAERLPDQVLLVLADLAGECIAGALMYHSDTTLYGRHWGCSRRIDGPHFEACYYQGIEFAIEQGLHQFEPGAQGEHKVARGFLPARTCSSHWLADERFRQPIADYVAQERAAVADYMCDLSAQLPYRKEPE